MRVRRVMGAVGRTLIAAGVLLLLFVAYQLWGTGFRTAQAQDRLEDAYRRALAATPLTTTTAPPSLNGDSPVVAAPLLTPDLLPARGGAAGRIEIADIGLDWVFVQGVSVSDLKKGPGHYPETPMPGQAGNAAIAGHRTTYGAPFNRIDELDQGDDIVITTVQGRFRYRVTDQFVIDPSQVEVLLPVDGKNTLTLTSCHPKYSARQRIIVRAELAGPALPAVAPKPASGADAAGTSLSGEPIARWPVVLYGGLSSAVWAAAWRLGRRWRRWPAYALGVLPFLAVLYLFFESVSRLLPADF